MRGIYFFVPGLSEKYQSGGLRVTQQLRDIFQELYPESECALVTTHEKTSGGLYVPDFLKVHTMSGNSDDEILCIVTWGPLVKSHIQDIKKNIPKARILYYAQSFGWNIKIPLGVPIVCVSRFVMSQWALYGRGNFVGYIPPALSKVFEEQLADGVVEKNQTNIHDASTPKKSREPLKNDELRGTEESPTESYYLVRRGGDDDGDKAGRVFQRFPSKRDIDILVHMRKQNSYCIDHLLPAIKKIHGVKIHTINSWIDQNEFASLLNRSKIFLYVTELHKAGFLKRLPGEGFGLPALEALASGCIVASNLFGGVTDFLTPGVNCIKVQNGSIEEDIRTIEKFLNKGMLKDQSAVLAQYKKSAVKKMWSILIEDIFGFPARL